MAGRCAAVTTTVRKLAVLQEALQRERQRLALARLAVEAEWVIREAGEILPPEASLELDAELRELLAKRRPIERGHLFITRRAGALRKAAGDFFADRPGVRYVLLLAHWVEAGAMVFPSELLGSRIGDLLELDGDTVYGCREDLSEVFAVDRTFEDDGLTFELFWFAVTGG